VTLGATGILHPATFELSLAGGSTRLGHVAFGVGCWNLRDTAYMDSLAH
jgi:hypothetical protein